MLLLSFELLLVFLANLLNLVKALHILISLYVQLLLKLLQHFLLKVFDFLVIVLLELGNREIMSLLEFF